MRGRENYPYSTGEGGRRQERRGKEDEDFECELQLSPMDVDKVLVNGVELTQDSTLATLRAACSFLGISGSGFKLRSTQRSQQEDGTLECQRLGERIGARRTLNIEHVQIAMREQME